METNIYYFPLSKKFKNFTYISTYTYMSTYFLHRVTNTASCGSNGILGSSVRGGCVSTRQPWVIGNHRPLYLCTTVYGLVRNRFSLFCAFCSIYKYSVSRIIIAFSRTTSLYKIFVWITVTGKNCTVWLIIVKFMIYITVIFNQSVIKLMATKDISLK